MGNLWISTSLRIEDAVDRPNTELEKNKVLVGQLPPGRHVMTARIGNETKIFEVIAKPNPPVISTLAAQLGQKGGKTNYYSDTCTTR